MFISITHAASPFTVCQIALGDALRLVKRAPGAAGRYHRNISAHRRLDTDELLVCKPKANLSAKHSWML